MAEYNNREGKVTALNQDSIIIDNVEYPATDWRTKCIISASQCRVGDPVIFNFNHRTRDIIYLRMKYPYYKGTVGHAHRYNEDPRDPDEVHDMEIMYGHDFEGM
jgi:hypothetical protein